MNNSLNSENLIETFIEKGEEATCIRIMEIYEDSVKIIMDTVLKKKNYTDEQIEAAMIDFFAQLFLNLESVLTSPKDISDVIFEFALYFVNQYYEKDVIRGMAEKIEQYKKYEVLPDHYRSILKEKYFNQLTEEEIAAKYNKNLDEIIKDLLNAELISEYFSAN